MILRRLGGIALLSIAVPFAPARAADAAGYGELGFDVGFADLDWRDADSSGGRLAIRGGYQFTPVLALEGQLFGMNAEGIPGFVDADDGLSIGGGTINLVFTVPTRYDVVPYFVVGAGIANATTETGILEAGVDEGGSAWQGAFGLRFYIPDSRRAGLRLELSCLREDTLSVWKTHFGLTAGLTWRLGD